MTENTGGELSSDSGIGYATCGTVGCHRTPVVVYRYAPGTDDVDYEETRLCLPCRRVVAFASAVPWGDTNERWHDGSALNEYHQENKVVTDSGRYNE